MVQDATQGFHWNNSQATLHTFVVYLKNDDAVHILSYCVMSDILTHNADAVHAVVYHMLSIPKTLLPQLKHSYYFSDGAPPRYKNFKNITNLISHQDHDLPAEWHFLATSHGKSPCDAIGKIVKHLVMEASLQNKASFLWRKCTIAGAERIKLELFFIKNISHEISSHIEQLKLNERYAIADKIAG